MTLTEYFEEQFRPGLREGNVAKLVDDEQFDGGELSLKFQETPLIARFHKLMNQPRRGVEGIRETTLAGRESQREARVSLAGAAIAEGDDVVTGDDIFAARKLQNERFVERCDGGEVERVETFHRREMRHAYAPLDHAALAIDEFELREP
jgi:hypothetical protein